MSETPKLILRDKVLYSSKGNITGVCSATLRFPFSATTQPLSPFQFRSCFSFLRL